MTHVYQSTPPEVRFWSKVEKTDHCWNWTSGRNIHKNKYPIFSGVRAHEWVARNVLHLVSDHKNVIDHECRNKRCVRPDHLRLVTQRVNLLNSDRTKSAQTHCLRGHLLSGENLYEWNGRRYCRACRHAYQGKGVKR